VGDNDSKSLLSAAGGNKANAPQCAFLECLQLNAIRFGNRAQFLSNVRATCGTVLNSSRGLGCALKRDTFANAAYHFVVIAVGTDIELQEHGILDEVEVGNEAWLPVTNS